MLYRTEDLARWGAGKGSNLEPVEIDLNFWELAQRLVAVEASAGEAANGIANIGVVGSQMTVYLEDGTPLGPFTLPVAMIRYRGDWTAASAYNEMDLVTLPSVGVYLVLADHTSGAAFDALAEDAESNPLYRWLFPMGSGGGGGGANVSDEGALIAAAPSDINFAGAGVTVTDDGDGTITVTIPGGGGTGGAAVSDEGAVVLAAPSDINFTGAGVTVTDDGDGTVTVTIPGSGTGGGASALDDLSDVTITGPAAAQFLRYDGAAFVNAVVSWADIASKPTTFAPAAHHHPWSDLTGVPATFAPSAHTHPATDVAGAVVETIAATSYTQIAADRAKWKRTTSASAVAVTIAANVNAAGDEITFQQGGAGQITFAAGAGLTLSTSGTLISAGPGAVVGIKFLSATEATLFGHTTGVGGGSGGSGDMVAAVYDPTSVAADAFDRANHHGEQDIGTVTGLQAALDAKAATGHAHAIADTTGLQAALDDKAPTAHTHDDRYYTEAEADALLAGKAAAAHTHAIADTTGLQAALDAKAAASHTHPVTDLQTTGTPNGTKFLRDDGAWAVPAGGAASFSGSWQDFTGSRAASTAYQNTTGKPIGVHLHASTSTGREFQTSPDNVTWGRAGFIQNGSPTIPQTTFVPADHFYRINGSVTTITAWWELR